MVGSLKKFWEGFKAALWVTAVLVGSRLVLELSRRWE